MVDLPASLNGATVLTHEGYVPRETQKLHCVQAISQALVADACNLSYSEGRDQRIVARSQPRSIVQETLSQKKTFTKKGLVEWLKV
jgi:hypothetical protein